MGYKEKPSQETLDAWHDDPSNWKWGVFYYNKEDKRLFQPKRLKWTGWTVNFANSMSILALLGLILLIFVLFDVYYIRSLFIRFFTR